MNYQEQKKIIEEEIRSLTEKYKQETKYLSEKYKNRKLTKKNKLIDLEENYIKNILELKERRSKLYLLK